MAARLKAIHAAFFEGLEPTLPAAGPGQTAAAGADGVDNVIDGAKGEIGEEAGGRNAMIEPASLPSVAEASEWSPSSRATCPSTAPTALPAKPNGSNNNGPGASAGKNNNGSRRSPLGTERAAAPSTAGDLPAEIANLPPEIANLPAEVAPVGGALPPLPSPLQPLPPSLAAPDSPCATDAWGGGVRDVRTIVGAMSSHILDGVHCAIAGPAELLYADGEAPPEARAHVPRLHAARAHAIEQAAIPPPPPPLHARPAVTPPNPTTPRSLGWYENPGAQQSFPTKFPPAFFGLASKPGCNSS